MRQTEKAVFAAGCFWGVEAAFRGVPGVIDVTSGYTGGATKDPTYREVCSDRTGHAEAVEIVFDPSRVAYDQLLNVFWQIHDPTTPNRQGPDVGTQYRSAIFTANAAQADAARASLEREQAKHAAPIVTQIATASEFFPAEEYHQRYHEKHGGTCQIVP